MDDRRSSPSAEVTCRRCATTVLVAKFSLAQTSIQWRGDAGATCAELARRRAAGQDTALVPACESLRESIDEAVREGLVEVPVP
ncbi:MAG: hypothetical protein M3N21_01895 [Actinomycetota bacterium]|nr:hypothetical protein [Actinomycetota bacterium]